MTHTTINAESESGGSTSVVYHTIDITGVDTAGAESYNPGDEVGIEVDSTGGIDVVGQADAAVRVVWDHINEQLSVVNVADATDVASGTAVGEVRLRVEGV